MDIKAIRNTNDYQEALKNIEFLVEKGVKKGSAEAEKLDVLVTLVQDYEAKKFTQNMPDPIDAIEFVMDQRELKPEDLVPYIGSRSKVSEILSRTRPLSLNMIKALHKGLDVPAEVLLNQSSESINSKFPVKEMQKRGYISDKFSNLEKEIEKFFGSIKLNQETALALLTKRTYYIRSPRTMNQNALLVWATQVVKKAKKIGDVKSFNHDLLTQDFLHSVVDLSDEDNSITKVIGLLKSVGINLIIEPHMPQTYLDGAAIMMEGQNPIVALTLRHDRLDNFWFALMHELAHIKLHYGKGVNLFYDDIENIRPTDNYEVEADNLAIEVMIPEAKWLDSPASILPSVEAATLLANELSIHPAIIAGKVRYDRGQYHLLTSIIGKGEVRKEFSEFRQ